LPGSIYFFSGNRGPPSVIEARTRATGATLIHTAASVCDEHAHRRFTIAEIAQDCRDTTAAKELRDLLGKLDSAITNDDALFALIERHRESWKNIDNAPTDDGLEQAAEANLDIFSDIKAATPATLAGAYRQVAAWARHRPEARARHPARNASTQCRRCLTSWPGLCGCLHGSGAGSISRQRRAPTGAPFYKYSLKKAFEDQ
jgi:hypothetical protein